MATNCVRTVHAAFMHTTLTTPSHSMFYGYAPRAIGDSTTPRGRRPMPQYEITLTVSMLNLIYEVRGFDAIRDLKHWLDEHASDVLVTMSLRPPAENSPSDVVPTGQR